MVVEDNRSDSQPSSKVTRSINGYDLDKSSEISLKHAGRLMDNIV